MAYVVIVCSRCRLARGAPEHARTASCPSCGRKLRVPELKKYHRTEKLTELAEAIGQLNARLKGGLDAYLGDLDERAAGQKQKRHQFPGPPQMDATAASPPTTPPVPASKLDRAVLAFLERRGPQRLEVILEGLPHPTTPERLEKRLEALGRAGLVFEPSAGVYARVP
jgi:hypothetical protein